MSIENTENTVANDTHRYGGLSTGDGAHIVYDRENSRAWIQSTVAVSIDDAA
jgi:hypothetical protein